MREKILSIIEKDSRIEVRELAVRLGEDEIAVANELKALEEENEGLRAEAACAVSLEELEDYALHVLGMQPCESRQIQIIDIGG